MALKTIVKITGVNNLSDARYCAGMGVEMLGFSLEKENDNYVSPEKYHEIIGWISGVKFVGEFHKAHLEDMNEILAAYPIHMLQVAREDVMEEIYQRTQSSGVKSIPIIFYIPFTTSRTEAIEASMERFGDCVAYFLLDVAAEVLSDQAALATLRRLADRYAILVGAGVSSENVLNLLNSTTVKGISMRGGQEIKPGLKDFDELANVLELIEVD